MNITMQRRFFVLLGVTAVTFVLLAACSERSLQSLLDGEESGAFELTTREVHLQASDEFTITARGGFTPYYFDLDNGVGDIDTSTGRYRSPETLNNGQFIEVPVLAMDNAGATDSATVLLYERLSVDPRTLDVHTGEQGAEVEVGGGFGSYFFELEREDDGSGGTGILGLPGEPDEEGVWHLTYNAPVAPGSVLLTIRDELANRVTVEITVYPEEELRISPTSETVVLNGGVNPITFEVTGGQGDPQDFELSLEPEDFGLVPPIAAGGTFEYTPPQEEGTATITVSCQQRLKSSGFQRFRSSAFLGFLQGQRPRFSSGPSSGMSLL